MAKKKTKPSQLPWLKYLIPIAIPILVQIGIFYLAGKTPRQIQVLEAAQNQRQASIQPTPTPSPSELEVMFSAYASYYKVDRSLLRFICFCESRFNPKATNGKHAGLYQFNPTTWSATRKRMNHDPNPELRFNAEEAVKTAAFKIAREGSGAWVVCSRNFLARS